jgi:hypothetical protein
MFTLYNKSTQAQIGTLSTEQLQILVNYFEEESDSDQDYWVNSDDLLNLQEQGADASLIAILQTALGDAEDMDIEWKTA